MTQFNWKQRMDAYLALREALGFSNHATRLLLQDFVNYLEQQQLTPPIRAQWALDWACAASARRGVSGQSARLSVARGFLTHLKASLPETEIPAYHLLAVPRRPQPYLFSADELCRLLAAAGRLGPSGSLRPHTIRALLGLMASTGLRPREAINLLVTDVNLESDPPRLLIRKTKFRKSRWVPLHPTSANQLSQYSALREQLHYAGLSEVFFISATGKKLDYSALRKTFHRLMRRLEISPREGQRRPTLHSLRHTFAVSRLRAWYEAGADARTLAHHLSVYLGHLNPAASYWYLTATPELLGAAAGLFESYAEKGGSQ
jgi:integrase/recombinase XerD